MFKWIDDKHRLVLINDETFQEERSFRLIPFNVFAILGGSIFLVSLITVLLLVFTPLGIIVPEQSNQDINTQLNSMYIQIDSLEQSVMARELYITKIRNMRMMLKTRLQKKEGKML